MINDLGGQRYLQYFKGSQLFLGSKKIVKISDIGSY